MEITESDKMIISLFAFIIGACIISIIVILMIILISNIYHKIADINEEEDDEDGLH